MDGYLLYYYILIIGLIAQSWRVILCDDNKHVIGTIGAIVDDSRRIGREERVAMEMAVHDFYEATNHTLILHIATSSSHDPIKTAIAARNLITKKNVEAILGPDSWDETSLVAKVGTENRVPILSFANSTPKWATESFPFLVQASPYQLNEMKAVAAIVQSWQWYQVTVIYEENSPLNYALPHLFTALREVGAEINRLVEIPPFVPSLLPQELERLKEDQCRVFIVHSSFEFAQLLFKKAKELKMMVKEYVWIVTDPIANLVHSFNASTISSMEGVLGVKTFVPEDDHHHGHRWQDFYTKFRKRFMLRYPKEYNHDPGSFAVHAYDATWAVAEAIKGSNKEGQEVLGKILRCECQKIGRKLRFEDQRLAPEQTFRIINIVGKGYRELGFWSDKLEFSKTVGEKARYNSSMKSLGQVVWPGGPWNIPRGWVPLTSSKPLRVGVPTTSLFKQIVNFEHIDDGASRKKFSFSGFSIDVFEATMKELPFYLPYEFFPFEGTYNTLVEQIDSKKFDAVIGDVSIVAHRYDHAEFTHPYTETGMVMVVPVRSKASNQEWLFLKPFTASMWILIVVVNLYNGFAVWLIERNYDHDLNGSVFDRIGKLVWLSFSTLFSLHGDKLHSNLTRMAMLMWLFVALVITQTYTANLTSMLTVQQLEPDIEALQTGNAAVGYCTGSYLREYLKDVLRYPPNKIKNFTTQEDYAKALRSREVAGIYLEVPLAKLFLAKYCKGFDIVEPTYKVGGFGFAFPKGSPLVPSVTKALLKVAESGKIRDLENSMLEAEKCIGIDKDDHEPPSLSLRSFWVLFVMTLSTSTISILIYFFTRNRPAFQYQPIWWLIMSVIRRRTRRNNIIDHNPEIII